MASEKDPIPSFESELRDRDERLAEALSKVSETEELLRQSQKLEAVGRLAGGVAHDFNNLLTVIGGYSALLLRNLPGDSKFRYQVQEIEKAAERASSLTRQLLAFSRKQILRPRVVDLNSIVTDLVKMLHRLIGEDINLHTILQPDMASIKVDPGQIEQVILNLVVNARDAMPKGGKLTIETKNVFVTEWDNKVAPGGAYAMLSVTDTGCGMDQETQARIFEPFFTTKEPGKGTGLGLSTVYGIVKQSGGSVWVYSLPDQGSTFRVYFPQIDEEDQPLENLPPATAAAPVGATILLVEDEEMVRRMTKEILEHSGYQVLAAPSGVDALRICEEFKQPIHLLLTDVVMPQMSGRELAEKLSRERPEMSVLYMSGYTDDALVQHGISNRTHAFLQKPFSPPVLLAMLVPLIKEACDRVESSWSAAVNDAEPIASETSADTDEPGTVAQSPLENTSETSVASISDSTGGMAGELGETETPPSWSTSATPWGRVLIVDDDQQLLASLEHVIQSMGCVTASASSGQLALDMAEEFSPDIALVDYNMDGMDGIEVMERLRSKIPDILPIMITGFPEVRVATGALRQSAFAFLTKPISIEDLQQCLWRAIAFREARVRERRQNDFLSTISHQLGDPLQVPMYYLGVLLDESYGPLLEKQRDFLRRALDGVKTGVDTINNLVNSRLLEDGRFAVLPSTTSLRDLIESVLDTYDLRAREKGLKFAWESPMDEFSIVVDKEHVKQAIGNLLSNAIDHSPSGKSVRIELLRSKGKVNCVINDGGCGIARKYHELVFTKSFQIAAAGEKPKRGLGFGLYVARTIIRAHGGDIILESEPGVGATFTVVLPDNGLISEGIDNGAGGNNPGR